MTGLPFFMFPRSIKEKYTNRFAEEQLRATVPSPPPRAVLVFVLLTWVCVTLTAMWYLKPFDPLGFEICRSTPPSGK